MNKDKVVTQEDLAIVQERFRSKLLELNDKLDKIDRSHKRDMSDQWSFLSSLGIRRAD